MIDYKDRTVTFDNGTVVESSFIEWVGYDSENRQMYVTYIDRPGEVRAYFDVPTEEFFDMIDNHSVGAYYNRNIRGEYSTRLLNDFKTVFAAEAEKSDSGENSEPFVTVGYADSDGVHFAVDGPTVDEKTIVVPGPLTVRSDLNVNTFGLASGLTLYDVEFEIGGEKGFRRVFGTDLFQAVSTVGNSLDDLHLTYEITGVKKV